MAQYRGLVNEGSTCYLNSLLQTLFMTPQFRQNVYSFVHDEKKIVAADSIPYQLQKLFVQLQLNQNTVYTKGLLRSFQWDDINSFQQHDVQEFCRILFEALEKASKDINWIEKLYSGVMESFISCGVHPRSNQQVFMDISLPMRSQFTKTYFKSIQQCLKEYLRPQTLDDKIDCEGCGQKVKVEKGMRLSTLPPILTLQVNRFQLNYQTMQRQKINSFLYFPQVLEMWRFLYPFEQIQIKGIPPTLFDKVKLVEKQKSFRQTDWFRTNLSVTGKGIERKKSFEEEAQKKQVKFYDEQNRDKRQDETKKLSQQEQKLKNLQLLKELRADKEKLDQLSSKNEQKISWNPPQKEQKKPKQENIQNIVNTKTPQVTPPSNSIEDDMLFGSFMDGFDRTGDLLFNEFQQVVVTNETSKGKSAPKFEKTEAVFEHEEEKYDPNKQYPDNTYVLFSVLVHSGGAYGGHYYAYISNGQVWYCFNDTSIKKVTRQQIRKYGHPTEQTSYGANAYLLFYRQAKTFKNIQLPIEIPPLILEKVRSDKTVVPEPTKQSRSYEQMKNRYSQIENSVIAKIKYQTGQLETILIPNRHECKVKQLKQLVKQTLKIEESDQNWRLRRYNKSEETLHQIYDENLDGKTLEQIGLRETCYMAVQVKKSEEQFEDYDPKNIIVKLNVWREGLTLLTESCLKPIKLPIRQQNTFEQFYHKVETATKIRNPLIIKRNFSVGNPYQIFNFEASKEKTLISLRFFNGINLYVEQLTQGKPKWDKQFEDQRYKCQIKFNNPKQGTQKNLEVFFDTRKTLGDLKQKISELIRINPDEFRIKKNQQSVSQMTQYKKRLVDLRFVNSQFLFIEEGKSSKGTVIIRKGRASLIDGQIDFTLYDEFQLQIQGNTSTVADLKVKLSEKYSIAPFNIRIREFKAHQFGQIFTDSESLLKIREKSLVWEELEIEDPKGLQIYLRVFDVMTLQLGPLLSIFVEPNGNYEQLALIISQETQIQSDKILVHKSMSNFIDKSLLFECDWMEIKYISKCIRQQPLYLSSDGEILIIKQSQFAYEPKPTKKYASSRKQESSKENKKQAALRITVVKEKDDQELIQQTKEEKDGSGVEIDKQDSSNKVV